MTALLLFGMQVDLLPGSPAEVPNSNELVQVANRLIPSYELIVAANFCMPADHLVFGANHLWRRPGQQIPIDGQVTTLQHIHCVQGSFGAEMIPGLQIGGKMAFTALLGTDKNIPPFSAFFDRDKKKDTGLAQFLKVNGVSQLHLAGMPLEDGLTNTALDSLAHGFKTKILVEACRGRSLPTIEAALEKATEMGCELG